MELVILVGALFGALVGVSAAQRRGFSVVGGLIGGLLLGILSPLMYLVSSERKKCASCCEWIQKEAKVCPKCQREVATD